MTNVKLSGGVEGKGMNPKLELLLEEVLRSLPSDVRDFQKEVVGHLVDALIGHEGRALLLHLVDEAAGASLRGDLTVAKWTLTRASDDAGPVAMFRERIDAVLKPVIEKLSTSSIKGQKGPLAHAEALGLAAGVLKQAGVAEVVPPQVLEVVDNIRGLDLGRLQSMFGKAPADGVVAAVLGLAISTAVNASRYNRGQIRWDDAIDSVVGDTIKAGLTGIILSGIAGGLALAPPLAIAVSVILAPIVYGVVSAVLDQVYERLLGGELIAEARSIHVNYLQVAEALQRDIWPRLKRLAQLGVLVDELSRLAATPEGRAKLARLVDARVSKTLSRTNLQGLPSGAFEQQVHGVLELTGTSPSALRSVASSEVLHLARLVTEECARQQAASSGFRRYDVNGGIERICAAEQIVPSEDESERDKGVKAILKHCFKLEKTRESPQNLLCFETEWSDDDGENEKAISFKATDFAEAIYLVAALQHSEALRELRLQGMEASSEIDEETALNPRYLPGLADGLRRGEYRLFTYRNSVMRGKPFYIAVPATVEAAEEQCQRLKEDLPRFNIRFERRASLLESLRPIEQLGDVDELTLHGERVEALEFYTATWRFEREDGISYSSREAYFHNLKEAKAGLGVPPMLIKRPA